MKLEARSMQSIRTGSLALDSLKHQLAASQTSPYLYVLRTPTARSEPRDDGRAGPGYLARQGRELSKLKPASWLRAYEAQVMGFAHGVELCNARTTDPIPHARR